MHSASKKGRKKKSQSRQQINNLIKLFKGVEHMKLETLLKIVVVIVLLALIILGYYYFYLLPRRGVGLVEGVPADVGNIRFLMAIYGPGGRNMPYFVRPNSCTVDGDGNIYVTDTGNHRVCVFNANGRFQYSFGEFGASFPPPGTPVSWKPGRFSFPYGIAVDEDGNIYVGDVVNNKIQKFAAGGRSLDWFPKVPPQGKPEAQVSPLDIEVYKGKLYVCDALFNNIAVFNTDGKYLYRLGQAGRKEGQFDNPTGIAIDKKDGTIYVSDKFNVTLTAMTQKGKVKWVVGKVPQRMGETKREFGLPAGVGIDQKGNVYVVDAFHFTLQVFSKKGQRLAEVGKRGIGKAQFNYARGLEVGGPDDNLFVVDMENNRVQVLKILKFVIEPQE